MKNRILNILIDLYAAVFGLLSALVLVVSMLTTVVFRRNEQNDLFDFVPENLPLLLCLCAAAAAVLFCLQRKAFFAGSRYGGRFHIGVSGRILLVFAAACSLFFILSMRPVPTNDASQLDDIINDFMHGEYGALESGGYLASYPFQIGYVCIGQLLYLSFGPSNFLVYQLLNVLSILGTLYCLYRIAEEISGSEAAEVMGALGLGAFVLYIYATFIYNDIWSLFPQTLAMYLQIRYLKTGKVRTEIGAGAAISIACFIKTNCIIALIAMVLTLGIRAIRALPSGKEAVRHLLLALCMIILTSALSALVKAGYTRAAGLERFPEGVPAAGYLAMGMQEMEGKYGWYDGYNVSVLHENGNDTQAASEAACRNIEEQMGHFRDSGRYFVKFYLMKFLSQWADPTQMSLRELEESVRHTTFPKTVSEFMIFGAGFPVLSWIMNVWHTLMYLGVVLYMVTWLLRRIHHEPVSDAEAMLVMFILGGMLFHQIWEAAGRYSLRYYVTMLPLAAYGYERLMTTKLPKGVRS